MCISCSHNVPQGCRQSQSTQQCAPNCLRGYKTIHLSQTVGRAAPPSPRSFLLNLRLHPLIWSIVSSHPAIITLTPLYLHPSFCHSSSSSILIPQPSIISLTTSYFLTSYFPSSLMLPSKTLHLVFPPPHSLILQ